MCFVLTSEATAFSSMYSLKNSCIDTTTIETSSIKHRPGRNHTTLEAHRLDCVVANFHKPLAYFCRR